MAILRENWDTVSWIKENDAAIPSRIRSCNGGNGIAVADCRGSCRKVHPRNARVRYDCSVNFLAACIYPVSASCIALTDVIK